MSGESDSRDTSAPSGGSFSIDDDVRYITPEEIAEATGQTPVDEAHWLPEGLLPEKFKDDPARFVKSYNELEAKIGSLAPEANRLRQENEQLRAAVAEQYELLGMMRGEVRENAPELAAYSRALQFDNNRAMLALDLAARQQVQQQAFDSVPGLEARLEAQANAPTEFSNGVAALLNEHVPDWAEYAPHVREALTRYPAQFVDEDPQVVAQRIAGVVERARQERRTIELSSKRTMLSPEEIAEVRRTKELAQSARGAGGRVQLTGDAAQQEWDAIRDAGVNSYADRRAGRP